MLEIVLVVLLALAMIFLYISSEKVMDLKGDVKTQIEIITHQKEMIKLQTELSQNYKRQFEIAEKYGDDLFTEHLRFFHEIERRMY